uniref:NADH-ubiquinone oxidoreductase chain 2 n=1 Tax=Proasellus margalefi TaxID=1281998 RepID=A0A485M6M4_9CRUS|nr:NADH dehydrogenase subunit 2 [Proasellus margalefi]
MFMSTLLLGIVIMLSSKTWFSVWLGLEINLLSFLPIILFSTPSGSEGGLKYFLIQALGSLLILQTSVSWPLAPSPHLFFTLPIILKLGAAPLHFWLPEVTKTLPWRANMILLTLQKTGPLYLLASVSLTHKLPILIASVFSTVVGSLGGLNELDLRKLMAFSSISHMGWMFVGMALTQTHWVLYFSTYIITSLTLITMLEKMNIFSLVQLSPAGKNGLLFMLLLLSLGGFPPLLGFAPKWAILLSSTGVSLPLSILLVVTSTITLYYYIRAGLMTLTLNSASFKVNLLANNTQTLLILMNTVGGGLYMFMWSSLAL